MYTGIGGYGPGAFRHGAVAARDPVRPRAGPSPGDAARLNELDECASPINLQQHGEPILYRWLQEPAGLRDRGRPRPEKHVVEVS